MSARKKDLLSQLEALSRKQTPDNWNLLRRQIEQAAPRIDPVAAQHKRRNITMIRPHKWLIAASAAALIIALGIGFADQLQPKPAAILLTAGQTLKLPGGDLWVQEFTRNGAKIAVPADAKTVDLQAANLSAIFGRDPIPALPFGLKLEYETISAIVLNDESVFLLSGITYASVDPAGAQVVIDLNDQGELPLTDCFFVEEKPSTWEGVELMIGVGQAETETGFAEQYVARFVVNNIGYQIQATGLRGEQFLAVLSAIIAG